MSGMLASLGDNQMFGAGFGLFSVGVAATVAKKGMQVKYAFSKSSNVRYLIFC